MVRSGRLLEVGPEIAFRDVRMTLSTASFQSQLTAVAADIETLLDRLLAAGALDGERARPKRLLDAMRYASLNGGKRFRPFLVAATASLFDVPRERFLMVGAALECVHCYSLVHDDLPAMDDDDLRRGQPTAHKKFDEATAILAGDGLLDLRVRHPGAAGGASRSGGARRARAGARPRLGTGRHGRRPDARSRRRRAVSTPASASRSTSPAWRRCRR